MEFPPNPYRIVVTRVGTTREVWEFYDEDRVTHAPVSADAFITIMGLIARQNWQLVGHATTPNFHAEIFIYEPPLL